MKAPQSDELKDFLLSRQNPAPANEIDWGERRREWTDAVGQLYRKITDELLAESIAQRLVTVSFDEKEVEEEYLGTYIVPELILRYQRRDRTILAKGSQHHRCKRTSGFGRGPRFYDANS